MSELGKRFCRSYVDGTPYSWLLFDSDGLGFVEGVGRWWCGVECLNRTLIQSSVSNGYVVHERGRSGVSDEPWSTDCTSTMLDVTLKVEKQGYDQGVLKFTHMLR